MTRGGDGGVNVAPVAAFLVVVGAMSALRCRLPRRDVEYGAGWRSRPAAATKKDFTKACATAADVRCFARSTQ